MKQITLDCSRMTGPEQVHDLFAQTLEFPSHYGRNLDALYDQLSTYPALELTLLNVEELKKMMRYGNNLLLAIQDAAKDNPNLVLILAD